MKVSELLDVLASDVEFIVTTIDKETLETIEKSNVQKLTILNTIDEFTAQYLNNQISGIGIDNGIMIIYIFAN